MNGKLFGLYSLENAVYFGARQYIHIGESVFYSVKPDWAKKLKIFDGFPEEGSGFDRSCVTVLTALGAVKMLSAEGTEAFFSKAVSFMPPDSTAVFDCPVSVPYRSVERLMSRHGFLIYETQAVSNDSVAYLAVRKCM